MKGKRREDKNEVQKIRYSANRTKSEYNPWKKKSMVEHKTWPLASWRREYPDWQVLTDVARSLKPPSHPDAPNHGRHPYCDARDLPVSEAHPLGLDLGGHPRRRYPRRWPARNSLQRPLAGPLRSRWTCNPEVVWSRAAAVEHLQRPVARTKASEEDALDEGCPPVRLRYGPAADEQDRRNHWWNFETVPDRSPDLQGDQYRPGPKRTDN